METTNAQVIISMTEGQEYFKCTKEGWGLNCLQSSSGIFTNSERNFIQINYTENLSFKFFLLCTSFLGNKPVCWKDLVLSKNILKLIRHNIVQRLVQFQLLECNYILYPLSDVALCSSCSSLSNTQVSSFEASALAKSSSCAV